MKFLIAILVLSVAVSFVLGQCPATGTCEQCKAVTDCVYCNSSGNAFCTQTSTCSAISGTEVMTCKTCTAAPAADYCKNPGGANKLVLAYPISYQGCLSTNSPTPSGNGSNPDACTDAVKKDGLACAVALYSFSCSFACGACDGIKQPSGFQALPPCKTEICDAVATKCPTAIKDCQNLNASFAFCTSSTDCSNIQADDAKVAALYGVSTAASSSSSSSSGSATSATGSATSATGSATSATGSATSSAGTSAASSSSPATSAAGTSSGTSFASTTEANSDASALVASFLLIALIVLML